MTPENDALRDQVGHLVEANEGLGREVVRLRAENERLRREAQAETEREERLFVRLPFYEAIKAERDALRATVERVRAETLREVAVECALEHDAGGYVVVQMSLDTWRDLRDALGGGDGE